MTIPTVGQERGRAQAAHLARRARLGFVLVKPKALPVPPRHVKPAAEVIVPFGVPVPLIGPPSWRVIITLAALKHGVTVNDVTGPYKSDRVVDARHEAIWLCRTHLNRVSTSVLGRLFHRDHTSIINSLKMQAKIRRGEVRITRYSNKQRRAISAAMAAAPC